MDAVNSRGGVARASTLQREGHSRHRIAAAVHGGAIHRVRRDWVAVPGADAELVAAARCGVVLTCVTQARRRGLWVLREDQPHVASPPHAGRPRPERAFVHWAEPPVPRHPDQLVDGIENVLAAIATCQPHDAALAIWDSAFRQGLVSRDGLAGLALPRSAETLLAEVVPYLDSGLESIFLTRLRWLSVRIVPQAWIHGHRVDFLIGERLVVQIDGGHHVGRQRNEDVAHDAQLLVRGYHVLRFGYGQIIDDWPAVQDVIVRAVARGLHRATRSAPRK
ncbi:uncharacterized protein DUF559 [Microbacterium sp. BK668]|nr:uncharacterized protein DUF559 [Microbacterium sp. BK668]